MAHKVALFYLLINYFHRFKKYYHQKLWDNHFRSTPTVRNVKAENSKDLSIEHGWQDLVRSIANGEWIFPTFICLCLFDSVLGLAVNNLLRVITPRKSMSKSKLEVLPSEVGIQVRLLVGSVKTEVYILCEFTRVSHGGTSFMVTCQGNQKSHVFLMCTNFSARNCIIMSFWSFMFSSCSITI